MADAPTLPRVLLVDDHEDTNRSMKLLLKRRGYQVETASDIATALLAAEAGEFDVLVTDMSLPDGTGLDLLRGMGARAPRRGGIVVSGYGSEEDVARSRAAGFQAHLSKPVDVGELDGVIKGLLEPTV